jgi:hypothetical protein
MKLTAAVLFQSIALAAADPSLLSLVMPDAKVIAGARVDQAKNSPFGMYVLTHLQLDDADFLKFVAATGFDPRRDVREVLVASNSVQYDPSHWLVLVKGSFNPERIEGAAQANGGTVSKHQGINILSGSTAHSDLKAAQGAIAFLDSSTAVMGDVAGVEAAIDRHYANKAVSTKLAGKVQQVSASYDFWFTTLVPLAEFAGAMPDPNLSSAMKGNLLGAIQQTSGGVKFGQNVQLYAEAVTRSPQDAAALVDVVKFLAGLIQTNRQNDKTAAQVSTLLDGLQTTTQGNVMTMSLAIPEATIEQMMSALRQERGKAKETPQSRPLK